MGLELKKYKDGRLRPHFYGRCTVDKKKKSPKLNKWEGKPPENGFLHLKGDDAFERSRHKAEVALEAYQKTVKNKSSSIRILEDIYETQTGTKIDYVKLSDLPLRWRNIPRETPPTEKHLAWCDGVFNGFAAQTKAIYLHEVTEQDVNRYMKFLRETYSRKTMREKINLLNAAFTRLLLPGQKNHFKGGINRKKQGGDTGDTIHRQSFTAEQIDKILTVARPNALLYPLIVTALSTGLRLGDVCRLSWSDVNLYNMTINVITNKTGVKIKLPIFDLLKEVLVEAQKTKRPDDCYVFPEAVEMYQNNSNGLSYRYKKLMTEVLSPMPSEDTHDATTQIEGRHMIGENWEKIVLASKRFRESKREKIFAALSLYRDGKSLREIETETGWARGGISGWFHEVEVLAEIRFMPQKKNQSIREKIASLTRDQKNTHNRMRAASLFDWHALRTTFVTIALSGGIPIETVRAITGHTITTTVLKYYYQPQHEHIVESFRKCFPLALMGNPTSKSNQNIPQPSSADVAKFIEGLTEEQRIVFAQIQKGQQ